ncbi:MAG: hypothetical protein DI565_12045 [Ancylobacter novellus]|uniref:Uncharacterized protein n=1 Tax=Ancylobacter novellus TaxID=921 RepID=A0A2W5ML50_ANCNO|nr:MAG: hypothetical protein DI565_12045 [Ancylobacter novellus]
MGFNTDDGFIVESRTVGDGPRDPVLTLLVLVLDEAEALSVIGADFPDRTNSIAASRPDLRAQAARLGIEPGTYRQT